MKVKDDIQVREIYKILEQVSDPEIPVLTITDLGIVREVSLAEGQIKIIITPTYTGCPAMDMIAVQIRLALIAAGFNNIKVISTLSPAWSTDWISESGKKKLFEYGIAPPKGNADTPLADGVTCPHCNSIDTKLISAFGSTACKALYKCEDCKEPFDYFKCY